MGKLPLKWIVIGLVVLLVSSYMTKQTEPFKDGEDMWPGRPTFNEVHPALLSQCPNNTRAREGRCPEFLGP